MGLLVALLGGLALVAVGSGPAYACSCASQTPEQYVEGADVIVTGTVVSVDRGTLGSADDATYVVEVDRVYRGEAGPKVEFRSEASGAACGLEGIETGTREAFFLQGTETGLRAGLCGGTGNVTERQLDALVGQPDPPLAESDLYAPSEHNPWLVVGSTAAAGIAAVVLLVWGRRRRVSG